MRALFRKKAQAILALLNHRTVGEASESIGVGQSTIFRCMQDPQFQEAYRAAKRRLVDQAIGRIQQATGDAVQVLQKIINDPEKPASSRVAAARIILDMAIKTVELEDLTGRIEALEKAIQR